MTTTSGYSGKVSRPLRTGKFLAFVTALTLLLTLAPTLSHQPLAWADPGFSPPYEPSDSRIIFSPTGKPLGMAAIYGDPITSSVELLDLAPMVADPDSPSLDDVVFPGLPVIYMPNTGFFKDNATVTTPTEDQKLGHVGTFEWCPLYTNNSVMTDYGKSIKVKKFYFDTPDGTRKALTDPDGNLLDLDPQEPQNRPTYPEIIYSALLFDGKPVGTSQAEWDKWKSRFFKNGIVTNDPADINLEYPVYLQHPDHISSIIPDGKTLFFENKRQLTAAFGSTSNSRDVVAEIRYHIQFSDHYISYSWPMPTYVSQAEVNMVKDNKTFTLKTKAYKDAENKNLKDSLYSYSRPHYLGVAPGTQEPYEDWPVPGENSGNFGYTHPPLCHPGNLASYDGFDSTDEMQAYLRSVVGETTEGIAWVTTVDPDDDINLRSIPFLLLPRENEEINYTFTSDTPGFTVIPAQDLKDRPAVLEDQRIGLVLTSVLEPAQIRVEKYTNSERSEDDMQVGFHLDKYKPSHVVAGHPNIRWDKGAGENPKTELDGPEKFNDDSGRHIIKGYPNNQDNKSKAYEIPLNSNQDSQAYDVEVGFDIVNTTFGSSINTLIVTDQNILEDTVPKDWQTGLEGKESYFECTINKKQFLYPYEWKTSDKYELQSFPYYKGESLPILVAKAADGNNGIEDPTKMTWDTPTEEPTAGKQSVTLRSTWNPATDRQELFIKNIDLRGPATGDGLTAAQKIKCVTHLKPVPNADVRIEDYIHHDKVSVYGQSAFPVMTLDPKEDSQGRRKVSSWSTDADNWWAKLQLRASIDVMGQVTHADAGAPDSYFRHDFTAATDASGAATVVEASPDPRISKPLNQFFRVSAGYQSRQSGEHAAGSDDLHKIRIKPHVLGTPVEACSEIGMVSSVTKKVTEVTGRNLPPGIIGYDGELENDTLHVFFPRTATFSFYLGDSPTNVTTKNTVQLLRLADGIHVLDARATDLQGCGRTECYYSITEGGPATEIGHSNTGSITSIANLVNIERKMSGPSRFSYKIHDKSYPIEIDAHQEGVVKKAADGWQTSSGDLIPTENIVIDQPLVAAYAWFDPSENDWTIELDTITNNPYNPENSDFQAFYPKNTILVEVNPENRTAVYTFSEELNESQATIKSWKTTVTEGTNTAEVIWTSDNATERQTIFAGPTIGLNGTLEFSEKLIYSDDGTAYSFKTHGQTVTVAYDPVTRVPVNAKGEQISAEFTLADPAQTKALLNPIDRKLYLNGSEIELVENADNVEASYKAIVPIKEQTPRHYRDYDPATQKLSLTSTGESEGCGPQTYLRPNQLKGQDALCKTSSNTADAANIHYNTKTDRSHNFTAQDPVYAAVYGDKTYVVESVANEVVRGSCAATQSLNIDADGFIELFDDSMDSLLSKETDKYLNVKFSLSGLASEAASYTKVDTYGVRANTDDDVSLLSHASVEASYSYEPTMSVEKSAATEPIGVSAEGVDVFKPGTLVDIRATMENTGGTALTDIQFKDSTGASPEVDFANRLVDGNTVPGTYYSIGASDPVEYVVVDGVLHDKGTGAKISVQPGEKLTIFGVLTMDMPTAESVHGDQVWFTTPHVTGTDSYRALVDDPQVIAQKVTAEGKYAQPLEKITWGDCSYTTPANDSCWKWNDTDSATYWEADGTNKLNLPLTKQGDGYVTADQPVSILVTNTGKSPLTDLKVEDEVSNAAGGVVDWQDATVLVGHINKGKISEVAGVAGSVKVTPGADGVQTIAVTLLKDNKTYALAPAKFNNAGEFVEPGDFVVITGKLPSRTITGGAADANDHSDMVKATAISTLSTLPITSNLNDWNSGVVIPKVGVKKFTSEPGEDEATQWSDPTGKPGDGQDSGDPVMIPVDRYTTDGSAVTLPQEVKILVTNEGSDDLSYIKISDESKSSVGDTAETWSTDGLTCMTTPNPDGGNYTVTEETTGEYQGWHKVEPPLKPNHSIRCTTTLPELTFAPTIQPTHTDKVTVVGFGEKSQTESAEAVDPWHAAARAAQVAVIKHSGEYTDSTDLHTLGTANGVAKLGSDAISVDPTVTGDTFTPVDKTLYYTVKNTGNDSVVKLKFSDETLLHTVGDPVKLTNPTWQTDAITCDVSKYAGAQAPSASNATTPGSLAFEITFTDEAPFKVGDTITCQSTLKYTGEPVNLSDSIWHANRATVSGFGITNREKETPGSKSEWHAYSAAPDVAIIKYIGDWEKSLDWDGTKTGDLPNGDADTAVRRGDSDDIQKALLLLPENVGTVDNPVYQIPEQTVGFTVRNTGRVPLDTVVLEDHNLAGVVNTPAEFDTGAISCIPGKEGLAENASVNPEPTNPKQVKITFAEDNLFMPGQVFNCHSVLAETALDPLTGAVHADEASAQGWREGLATAKATDPAHAYSVAPTISLTKESIDNNDGTLIKRAGTQDDPDLVTSTMVDEKLIGHSIPIRFTVKSGAEPITLSSVKVVDRRDPATQGSLTFKSTPIDAKLNLQDGTVVDISGKVEACPDTVNPADCSVVTFTDPTGEHTVLAAGDTITYEGIIGDTPETAMEAGALHRNLANVAGIGQESKLEATAKDEYHAMALKTDSHTFKYSEIPGVPQTKQEQLENNACKGGEAGKVCVIPSAPGKSTSAAHKIFMDYTNTGNEDLKQVKISDTTTRGKDLQIAATGSVGSLTSDREFVDARTVYLNPADSVFYNDSSFTEPTILKTGETLRVDGTMPEGALDEAGGHADTVKFTAVGVFSEIPTESEDSYESTWRKPDDPPTPVIPEETPTPEIPVETPTPVIPVETPKPVIPRELPNTGVSDIGQPIFTWIKSEWILRNLTR